MKIGSAVQHSQFPITRKVGSQLGAGLSLPASHPTGNGTGRTCQSLEGGL